MTDQSLYRCACQGCAHCQIWIYEHDDRTLYLTTHMDPLGSFWSRLRRAWRYLWGGRDVGYGDFAEMVVTDPEEARRMACWLWQKSTVMKLPAGK